MPTTPTTLAEQIAKAKNAPPAKGSGAAASTKRKTPLSKLSPAERAKRIAELVKKPGTRATVPTDLLPPEYRKMRERNTRLKQPIVEGSPITFRDLERDSAAAATSRYGQVEQQAGQAITDAQQREKDVGSWYDQYQAKLADHRTNTQTAADAANTQMAGLTSLTQQAAPAGAPQDAANQETAAKAAAIRHALLNVMQGTLAGTGRSAVTYADALANVVAPGQRLGALTTARDNTTKARNALTGLLNEKGAFRTQYESEARGEETKNVLSRAALNLDAVKAQAGAEADAAEASARLNKYGFTTSEWNKLSASEKKKYRDGTNKPKATPTTGYGAGRPGMNKFGYTYDEWNGLTTAQREKARAGTTKPPKPKTAAEIFEGKYGVKPASGDQVTNALNGIQAAQSTLSQIVNSDPKAYKGLTRSQASRQLGGLLLQGQKGVKDDPKTKDVDESSAEIKPAKGIWATVALDLAYLNGRISAGTADRLHRAGFSVKQLGLRTAPRHLNRPGTANDGRGQQRPT